jgi:hypothetical protein
VSAERDLIRWLAEQVDLHRGDDERYGSGASVRPDVWHAFAAYDHGDSPAELGNPPHPELLAAILAGDDEAARHHAARASMRRSR